MKRLSLKEPRAPYTVTLNDDALDDEALLVTPDGQPFGVILPMAEYEAYKVWRAERRNAQVSATSAKLERERRAFERLKPDLLNKHLGRAVAVHDEQIAAVGAEGEPVPDFAVRVYKQYGYLPIYFGVVEEKPRLYQFPYFKVAG